MSDQWKGPKTHEQETREYMDRRWTEQVKQTRRVIIIGVGVCLIAFGFWIMYGNAPHAQYLGWIASVLTIFTPIYAVATYVGHRYEKRRHQRKLEFMLNH